MNSCYGYPDDGMDGILKCLLQSNLLLETARNNITDEVVSCNFAEGTHNIHCLANMLKTHIELQINIRIGEIERKFKNLIKNLTL